MFSEQNKENMFTLRAAELAQQMIKVNPCHAEYIKDVTPSFYCQPNRILEVVNTNSHIEWQTVQIQISWLVKKPTELDLHCLQRQGISESARSGLTLFNTYPAVHDNPYLCKQCRSKSDSLIRMASEEAIWSGSTLFVIQFVNLNENSIWCNLVGW